jgi:predicted Zn-ribbon and HTH transcriptional regulator
MRKSNRNFFSQFNYQKRRLQLAKAGESAESIREKIHREYGIHLRLDELKKLINKHQTTKRMPVDNDRRAEVILQVLKESSTPCSLSQITELISTKNKVYYSSSVIRKVIIEKLQEQVLLPNDSDICSIKVKDSNFSNTPKKSDLTELDAFLILLVSEAEQTRVELDTGIKALNLAVKQVLRDNVITPEETQYLEEKAKEYNYTGNIISEITSATNQNNPYLDDIIDSIYHDGIISPEELKHLKKNAAEIGLLPNFLNSRFWTISLSDFVFELSALQCFLDFVAAIKFSSERSESMKSTNPLKLFQNYCNLYDELTIEDVLKTATKNVLVDLAKDIRVDYSEIEKSFNPNHYHLVSRPKPRVIEKTDLISMLLEEGQKIGLPAANLLIENVLIRLSTSK